MMKQTTLSRVAMGVALFLSLTFASGKLRAQVVLNEVLADNRSAVANDGNYTDYIELYNPTAAPVNIGNWSLTDDPALPRKYVIPADTVVPAQGFFIIWADRNFSSPGLHTGFGLGAKGDLVRLYAANGVTLLDEIRFGLQVGDFSLGRVPDGSGSWGLNQPSAGLPNTTAATGDPQQLFINEWMAKTAAGEDWLEVFNADSLVVALGGLIITDQPSGVPANRAIPAHSYIAAGGFIQFFADDLKEDGADHLDFKLSTSGETLTIYAADRRTILDRVTFGPQTAEISQGRAPDGSDNFAFFPGSATPGARNFIELTRVVISEVLSHTDYPYEDAIELQNLTATPVDISHWWLSDSGAKPRKYRIPAGTVIPAYGFQVFYEAQFGAGSDGFALSSVKGEKVFLSVGNAAGQLTGEQMSVRFGALKNGVSAGRHLTSIGVDFVPLSRPTFGWDNPQTVIEFRQGTGQTNAAPRLPSVVINEIMFYPPDVAGQPNTGDEYIELHNPGKVSVLLADPLAPTNTWQLRDGITFDFPEGISIPAGGYLLVVGFDPVAEVAKLAAFRAKYAVPTNVAIVGPYGGKLSNSGEVLEFLEPDTPQNVQGPTPGLVPYMQAERIHYASTAPWPTGAAGTGQSLQRRSAVSYGNEPMNWRVAAPSPGRINPMDSDGDGMPDAWELVHGLDPDSPLDADLDADQDGASNLQEYLVGTDPQDADSVFAFTDIRTEGSGLRLQFHAVQGRTYSVQTRDLATSGSWQTITNLTMTGETGSHAVWVPGGTDSGRLFRLYTPAVP
ncbi:MAG: lamin tail domain-containing protein [Verrucomicrobia bacterium]|nr:lamin tail domain-containing protein [Verrucomicrobiota bacterium]